ncbi:DUF1236 domain-containing protein [Neorhizobium tomejilense]|uniref:DUF1236 domain-containing protein n=1 Tax=Neorhizobium tomejilense TaxID=2093828 RepID=UPI000CF8D3D6|nr:DUF1236 domain-containing protein [Neorhizobium tomejilense]
MKNLVLAAVLVAIVGGVFAQQPTVAPSDKAVEFVSRQPMPANPVQVSEKIAVGQPIPNNLVLSPIPDTPNFAFAIVNQKRLIIDPKTFVVVRIVE